MITIREVLNKVDQKQFFDFPNQLYKSSPYYVPFINEENGTFNPAHNTSFDYCECRLFLCFDELKVVGRFATIINHRYNDEHNVKEIRFFRYDVINNFDVSDAIFNKIKQIAIENGLTTIVGEMGFNQFDHYGLLTYGYDDFSIYNARFNNPYQIEHLKKLNFVLDNSWNSYRITIPQTLDERVDGIAQAILKRYNLKLESFTKVNKNTNLIDYINKSISLRVKNLEYLYSFNTLSEDEISDLINLFKGFIDTKYNVSTYYLVVLDKDNDVVAFLLAIPSLAKFLVKAKFAIVPSIAYVYHKASVKSDSVDLISFVVNRKYQNIGLAGILQNELFKLCQKNDINYINTSFDFDISPIIKDYYQKYDMKKVKTFASFKYDLDKTE